MIPPFDNRGTLPEGLHDTTLAEIRQSLGFSERRAVLIDGLERCLNHWRRLRVVESVVIDVSFVTAKWEPSDIDLLVVPIPDRVSEPAFTQLALELWHNREAIKEESRCDAIPVDVVDTENYKDWMNFFSTDREGNVRGLLRVSMGQ